MTLDETRQLGIEFERRVQTMIPEKELLEKLDTETIYSFLNQYQDKYIHDIYRNLDSIPSGTKISAHVESVLQKLINKYWVSVSDPGVLNGTIDLLDGNQIPVLNSGRSIIYPIPDDFYLYLRSVSKVEKTFSFRSGMTDGKSPIRVLPNELISQSEAWTLVETPHDTLRILRRPAAILSNYVANEEGTNLEKGKSLTVIYDQYTKPLGIEVLYYKQPAHFNLMTSTPCELPMDAFDDLVTGALELYIQYVSGAEANRRRQQEAIRQQAKQKDDE